MELALHILFSCDRGKKDFVHISTLQHFASYDFTLRQWNNYFCGLLHKLFQVNIRVNALIFLIDFSLAGLFMRRVNRMRHTLSFIMQTRSEMLVTHSNYRASQNQFKDRKWIILDNFSVEQWTHCEIQEIKFWFRFYNNNMAVVFGLDGFYECSACWLWTIFIKKPKIKKRHLTFGHCAINSQGDNNQIQIKNRNSR